MTSRHPIGGALLFVLGLFLFACMDTTVKVLTAHYPVPVIAAMRYLVHCALMLALLAPSQGRQLVRTTRTGLVVVRGACLAVVTLCAAFAFRHMPVAEATAIFFVSPLLVVLVAGPILGESVGRFEWGASLAGFVGLVIIARPGGALDPVGVAFALGAATLMAAYQLLSRLLASTESTLAMLFYTALVGSVAFGLALPWFWEGPMPPLPHALLFLFVGACGGLGHFLFTAAYRQTEASALAPLLYVQLLWAGLLGWLVFDHVPDAISVLGMAIVAVCGAVVGLKSRLAPRDAEAAADMEP
ncbi:MAG TPA: DMT family transporter [Nevskiaceae bacterium]|nr:DMT family transporter [Nevskiaceae bacterium]